MQSVLAVWDDQGLSILKVSVSACRSRHSHRPTAMIHRNKIETLITYQQESRLEYTLCMDIAVSSLFLRPTTPVLLPRHRGSSSGTERRRSGSDHQISLLVKTYLYRIALRGSAHPYDYRVLDSDMRGYCSNRRRRWQALEALAIGARIPQTRGSVSRPIYS